GGVQHRNKVRDLRTWTPPADATDVYTTWLRFTADFARYTAGNPSPTPPHRPPSVAGYDGDALAPFLPFDIDRDDDLDAALGHLRRLLGALAAGGIALAAVATAFSGKKGFSIELPAQYLGGPFTGPCRALAARVKRVALRLAAEAAVEVDPSI